MFEESRWHLGTSGGHLVGTRGILGIVCFREPMGVLKLASAALIIAGVVGLKLSGGTH